MRKTRKKKVSRWDRILEMPKEITSGIPKVTIMGFEQMVVENYKSIMEYQDFFIQINTNIGIININGFQLKLTEMTTDDILITGRIESVDFEKTQEDE